MKTPKDPRHKRRINIFKELFAWGFNQAKPTTKQAEEIVANIDQIDKEIEEGAPEWPLAKINKVDLSILRLAIFELIIEKDVPYKVVVDEAVELAKEFGSDASFSFINGALGKVISKYKIDSNHHG